MRAHNLLDLVARTAVCEVHGQFGWPPGPSPSLLGGRDVLVPLEDAVQTACIEAVFRSAESGGWELPEGVQLE